MKLLHCPFCGIKPRKRKFKFGVEITYWIECMNKLCPIQPSTFLGTVKYGKTLEKSIERWNTRA